MWSGVSCSFSSAGIISEAYNVDIYCEIVDFCGSALDQENVHCIECVLRTNFVEKKGVDGV